MNSPQINGQYYDIRALLNQGAIKQVIDGMVHQQNTTTYAAFTKYYDAIIKRLIADKNVGAPGRGIDLATTLQSAWISRPGAVDRDAPLLDVLKLSKEQKKIDDKKRKKDAKAAKAAIKAEAKAVAKAEKKIAAQRKKRDIESRTPKKKQGKKSAPPSPEWVAKDASPETMKLLAGIPAPEWVAKDASPETMKLLAGIPAPDWVAKDASPETMKLLAGADSPKKSRRAARPRGHIANINGLVKIAAYGDGHCFYRSILIKRFGIGGDTIERVKELRDETATLIDTDPHLRMLAGAAPEKTLKEYLKGVRSTDWAGQIETLALSKNYPLVIYYQSPQDGEPYRKYPGDEYEWQLRTSVQEPIFLYFNELHGSGTSNEGNHYDLLVAPDDELAVHGSATFHSAKSPNRRKRKTQLKNKKRSKTVRKKRKKKTKRKTRRRRS